MGRSKRAPFRVSPWVAFAGISLMVSVVAGCANSDSGGPGLPETVRQAPSGALVGVVDTQWLLKKSKLGERVNEALGQFMKDRQTLLELEQQELRNLENEIVRQGSVLSPAARQQKEEQLRQRMLDYQQKVGDMSREAQSKQGELFGEFREQVDVIVQQLAQQRGLVLVVEKGKNTSTRYYEPSLDLSATVLEILDRQGSTE